MGDTSVTTKRPKLPFALVEWDDPHSPDATDVVSVKDLKDIHGAIGCISVGWILRSDDTGITLAAEYCGDDDYRSVTFITRAAVRTVSPIAISRSRRLATTTKLSDPAPPATAHR